MQQQELQAAKRRFFNFLKIDIAVNVLLIGSAIWEIGLISDLQAGHRPISASNISAITFWDNFHYVAVLTWIGVGIGLYKWLVACYEFSKHTCGASAFAYDKYIAMAWVGPLVVYRPYRILKEIFQAGGSYSKSDGWKQEKVSGYLLSWWVFWVTFHLFMFAMARFYREQSNRSEISIQQTLELVYIGIFIFGMSIAVALLWFWVVRILTERLLAKQDFMSNRSETLPAKNFHGTVDIGLRPYPVATEGGRSATFSSSASIEAPELATLSDEALYERALNEITDGSKRPGLWAIALAQSAKEGNPDGAYIALRVAQLQRESTQDQRSMRISGANLQIQHPSPEPSRTDVEKTSNNSRKQHATQDFLHAIESVQSANETKSEFRKLYLALRTNRSIADAKTLIWLCEYDFHALGEDPQDPNSFVVRKHSGAEPIFASKTEREFVNWAITTLDFQQPENGGYI